MAILRAATVAALMLFFTCDLASSTQVISVSNEIKDGIKLQFVIVPGRLGTKRNHSLSSKPSLAYKQSIDIKIEPDSIPKVIYASWVVPEPPYDIYGGYVYHKRRDSHWCKTNCGIEVRKDGVYGKNETTSEWFHLCHYRSYTKIKGLKRCYGGAIEKKYADRDRHIGG